MFCTNCGSKADDGARFCENCGAPLTPAAPKAAEPAVPETVEPDFRQAGQEPAANGAFQQPSQQPPCGQGSFPPPGEQGYTGGFNMPPYVESVCRPKAKVDFGEAIRMFFTRYFDFQGRSVKSEYWWIVLFNLIVGIILGFCTDKNHPLAVGNIVSSLWSLATLIPSIALGVRRLHDSDRSGFWLLITLVPFIGFIVLIVFMLADSSPDNQYGPAPVDYDAAPFPTDSGSYYRPQGPDYCQAPNPPQDFNSPQGPNPPQNPNPPQGPYGE